MGRPKLDIYETKTPQEEIDICSESCPHPNEDVCGNYGCEYFREQKAKLLAARGYKGRGRRKVAT